MRALVHCNFLKEVRLGGLGTEWPQAPTLGRHVSVCATILRLLALLILADQSIYDRGSGISSNGNLRLSLGKQLNER